MKTQDYKNLSIREFTKAAAKYDGNHAGIYRMCRKDYPDILAEIKKEPFQTLLDVGCGTGPMITLLSEEYPEAHFTGIDLTPAMIEAAKEKHLPNAEFLLGDAENLPFDNHSFDVAICSQSFHHYPNPQAFFNSVSRVLRPEGRLIIRDVTFNSTAIRWFANHIELPVLNKLGYGDVRIYGRDEVNSLLEKAGMKMETFEKRSFLRMHCVARVSHHGAICDEEETRTHDRLFHRQLL